MKKIKQISAIGISLMLVVCIYIYTAKPKEAQLGDIISNTLQKNNEDFREKERIDLIVNNFINGISPEDIKTFEVEETEQNIPKDSGVKILEEETKGFTTIMNDITDKTEKLLDKKEPQQGEYIQVTAKTIIDSNLIEFDQNGKIYTGRLIGVAGGGDKAALKSLIDSADSLYIEFDILKKNNNNFLVYLWNGIPSEDIKYMVNIQMVNNKFAICSYDPTSNIIEQPNIKYMANFIDAQK